MFAPVLIGVELRPPDVGQPVGVVLLEVRDYLAYVLGTVGAAVRRSLRPRRRSRFDGRFIAVPVSRAGL